MVRIHNDGPPLRPLLSTDFSRTGPMLTLGYNQLIHSLISPLGHLPFRTVNFKSELKLSTGQVLSMISIESDQAVVSELITRNFILITNSKMHSYHQKAQTISTGSTERIRCHKNVE